MSHSRIASILAGLAFACLALAPAPASADRWLCPDCPDEVVERAPDAPDLVCPGCGRTYQQLDLIPPVGYINSRTRDTDIAWIVQPENCPLFREDGLQALDDQGEIVYVPWSLVEYYIPRMRLLRLTNGREMKTDYPGRNTICPDPPPFLFETTDSLTFPGQPATAITEEISESMAELFIVAFSPEARDSARVRFVTEVEAGKHPRLPRTQPILIRTPEVHLPPALARPDLKTEAVVEVRVHERRGIIGAKMVSGTGDPQLDQEAMRYARMCPFGTGGELGVGVPSWVQVHVFFEGQGGRVEVKPAPHGFWRG